MWILVPMEEEKVRAGVSGCKQSCVFNKYYLYNYGGLGASRRKTEGDSLFKGNIFPFGLDLNVQRHAGM